MCGIRCGIYVSFNSQSESHENVETEIPKWLVRRGPDEQQTVAIPVHDDASIILQASVLCLRPALVPQPCKLSYLSDEQEEQVAYFCWNGEVYPSSTDNMGRDILSDTQWMANQIQSLLQKISSPAAFCRSFAETVLGRLQNAEFAFCLVVPQYSSIYYGRDLLGRRSLVLEKSSTPKETYNQGGFLWKVSSVAERTHHNSTADKNPVEVRPSKIFSYNYETHEETCHSWELCSKESPTILQPDHRLQDPNDLANFYQSTLARLLEESVQRRLVFRGDQLHSKVAILFSGGLDSVVLAYYAIKLCPEVELVNVSFVKDGAPSTAADKSAAADTKAAYASLADLQKLFPEKNLQLNYRSIAWNDIERVQKERIPQLLSPKDCNSTMDLNIATALWFAAETSSCRILMTGLGADEWLGGYGRHRKAFEAGCLREELALDQERIWERNLGRDDRVLSDLNKEVRYPFLDVNVTRFLDSVPLNYLVDYSLPVGDKHLLRTLAASLGLTAASQAVKRAIQFGSRISHVVDKERFGSRRKANKLKQQQSRTIE